MFAFAIISFTSFWSYDQFFLPPTPEVCHECIDCIHKLLQVSSYSEFKLKMSVSVLQAPLLLHIYPSTTHYFPSFSGSLSLGPSYLGVMRTAKGVMSDVALWLTPDSLAGLPP